ncbi:MULTISPECIES: ABC transporter ATP-binding protein [Aeribacillus]|jgi:ABC-type nitrate/sulfonate/bicarbonate transport system, ATPase component|uniref:ABC transporter ATP-binding protein n=1 Tax=Aeribacillus composti TaxID=1868734 RepID=A0ABY9WDU0_9BACI|nr:MULTISPECIES: ABC transporter ATP-binding protein [Aeribacillus]MDR9791819.1 ABC transporter ATP-binding protein [Aeribacillus pallidus]MED0650613.1 ABC transporter ATP-binding protein [Aeribacillus composti]MED0701323.1 ABC transporter ATP-binding protein [Aeribacillus composti]MED0716615.1 ABC transporter ATP-binding protein [Aeribacillus composti]MED0746172.1 ABC transporter ATP-binding protein [Aeribacillus composti]
MLNAIKAEKNLRQEKIEINIQNLSKVYKTNNGSFQALENVSLYVKNEEFVSILGPSGCGKSTILRILAGLEEPTSGSVQVSGEEVKGPSAKRGMVFQSYTLFPWLTVRENIEFGLKLKGMKQKERKEISDRYLELVGLERFADSYGKELSGGMKQRVAIARSLANNPEVLLMDEPFGALDAQTKQSMQQLLLDIWKKEKTTIVFITHDIDEALFLSQRIYVMEARPGRILEEIDADLQLFQDGELVDVEKFMNVKKHIISLLKH